jgi:hypothetical protein
LGAYGQYVIPLSFIANPDSSDIALFGNFSFDGSTASPKTAVVSGQSGFVINSKVRRKDLAKKNSQITLNFNPIIVGMNPFNWNNIVKQPVDSFYFDRLPYAEDGLLHIGVRLNSWKKQLRTGGLQQYINTLFADLYWRPYIIEYNNNEYRFQVINLNSGYQMAYLQKEIPVIGNFLLSLSPQLNYMYINLLLFLLNILTL